jgi:hypothetical protein
MVSHENKFIFIHIPRTGGTSIEFGIGKDMWKEKPEEKHMSASQTKEKCGDEVWEEYFKFSFVRDPWERVVSLWKTRYYGLFGNLYDFLLYYKPKSFEAASGFYNCVDVLDEKIDFIGRFENLQEDVKHVSDKIGISIQLPHKEKTKKKHYSNYYDARTKSVVDHLYKRDIDHFGYSFKNLSNIDSLESINTFQRYFYIVEFYLRKFKASIRNNYTR